MLGGILIVILTGILAFWMIGILKARYPVIDATLLKRLFFFHTFMAFVYYLYALFNPSDSQFYYEKILIGFRGENWMDFYGTSTTFIEFVGFPFIRYLGFSYEAVMFLFSYFGYLGFVYLHIFFRENIKFNHTLFGVDLMTLFFFLPNLHFWSGSFGKGSIIFMAISLFFFGISQIRTRWLSIIIGGVIIYHVRPHIMLVMLVSSAIGFIFSSKGVSLPLRLAFLAGAGLAFFYIYGDVMQMVGIDEGEFATQGLDLTHRATELSKATSGIDITNYSLPMQFFTFVYRPLFVDAPGMLGLIVSFENVFYVIVTLKVLNLRALTYLFKSSFLVKTAFFSFLTVSLALAQISGNLGLAIRQKSQVMLLFMFVIMSFMDQEKMKSYQIYLARQMRNVKPEKV